MHMWDVMRHSVTHYFSEPGKRKPSRQGFFLNSTTKQYEIWMFVKDEEEPIEFKRMAYVSASAKDEVIERLIRNIFKEPILQFGEKEVIYWLLHGKLRNQVIIPTHETNVKLN